MPDPQQDNDESVADRDEPWADDPEPKIELIDGRLICSTLEGSRRILWQILNAFGPACAIPMAPVEKWLAALAEAFSPTPLPRDIEAWKVWADSSAYKPNVPVAEIQLGAPLRLATAVEGVL